MTTEVIQRCPFCGAKPGYEDNDPVFIETEQFQTPQHSVLCEMCEGMGPRGDNRAEAIERWNERFTNDIAQLDTLAIVEKKLNDALIRIDEMEYLLEQLPTIIEASKAMIDTVLELHARSRSFAQQEAARRTEATN